MQFKPVIIWTVIVCRHNNRFNNRAKRPEGGDVRDKNIVFYS